MDKQRPQCLAIFFYVDLIFHCIETTVISFPLK